MKKELDKYYTPINIANYVWDKADKLIGLSGKYIIEPSCGNGSFCHWKIKPDLLIDIKPEMDGAIEADFINCALPYKKNSVIIGNPPFGYKGILIRKFFMKAISIADYIVFILPIQYLDNTQFLYQFDLIYSEDLGIAIYSNTELHCCLNIYKRPLNGFNQKPINSIDEITIYRNDYKNYDKLPYDIRIGGWGNSVAGRILQEDEKFALEYKIVINDKEHYDLIYNFIMTFDWKNRSYISMKKLQKWHILKEVDKFIIDNNLKNDNVLF